jgi:hypothetical protein
MLLLSYAHRLRKIEEAVCRTLYIKKQSRIKPKKQTYPPFNFTYSLKIS